MLHSKRDVREDMERKRLAQARERKIAGSIVTAMGDTARVPHRAPL